MEFDVHFFISVIIGFIISVGIFLVSYSIFNIVISKKKVVAFLKKNNYNTLILSSIMGLFMGGVTVLSEVDSVYMQHINVFLIANILVYAITFNVMIGYVGILTCIGINVSLYFTNNINFFDLMNSILLLSLMLMFTFISYVVVFKNNLTVFIYILFISIIMNLNALIETYHPSDPAIPLINIFISNIALFLYLVTAFVLTRPFTKFILNAKNINENTYMKDGFILNKFYKKFFYNYITNKNVQYGILFVINFNLDKEITSKYMASFIKNIKLRFIDAIRLELEHEEVLYFLTKENNYAFFIKLDKLPNLKEGVSGNELAIRKKSDILSHYEEKFKSLPFDILIDEKSYNRQFKFVATYYGIQSNDIQQLTHDCDQNLNDYHKNMIYLIDPNQSNENKIIEQKKNNILIQEKFFAFDEVKVKENDLTINGIKYQYFTPFIVDKLLFSWNDFLMISKDENVIDAITSHISSIALKEHQTNAPVLINYHQLTLMNNSFNTEQFIDKIKTKYHTKEFGINILMNNLNVTKTFIDNIQCFKHHGIKCYVHSNEDITKLDNLSKVFKIKPIKYTKDAISDYTPNFTI